MKRYPSNISREQFKRIRETLESCWKKTRPQRIDLSDVFCGVLCILKSGCQWRMLPHEYPKLRTCYSYFQIWNAKDKGSSMNVLETAFKKYGWRGETKQLSKPENKFCYHWCPECQEYGDSWAERLWWWQEGIGHQTAYCLIPKVYPMLLTNNAPTTAQPFI